jgi:hypothetical protein
MAARQDLGGDAQVRIAYQRGYPVAGGEPQERAVVLLPGGPLVGAV